MFVFGGEAFWLNVTNTVLGVGILAFVVVIVWSVILEIMFQGDGRRVGGQSRTDRNTARGLPRYPN